MSLVMVTIVKLTHRDVGNYNIQNCFLWPNDLTISTEILNLYLWSDVSSYETESRILKNQTVHFK